MVFVAAILTAAVLAVPISPPMPVWAPDGCDHLHRSKVAYSGLRKALRHTWGVDRQHVRFLWRCTTTKAKAKAAHRKARRHQEWRETPPQLYWIRYHRLPKEWRVWAERVVQCESGGNPYASNGTHHGRFQWLMSTWAAAGGTGSPVNTSYPQEAVIAIGWARRAGVGQWACK